MKFVIKSISALFLYSIFLNPSFGRVALDCESFEECEKLIYKLDVERNRYLGEIDVRSLSARDEQFVIEQDNMNYPTVDMPQCSRAISHMTGYSPRGGKPSDAQKAAARDCAARINRDIMELKKANSRLEGLIDKQKRAISPNTYSPDKTIIIR